MSVTHIPKFIYGYKWYSKLSYLQAIRIIIKFIRVYLVLTLYLCSFCFVYETFISLDFDLYKYETKYNSNSFLSSLDFSFDIFKAKFNFILKRPCFFFVFFRLNSESITYGFNSWMKVFLIIPTNKKNKIKCNQWIYTRVFKWVIIINSVINISIQDFLKRISWYLTTTY